MQHDEVMWQIIRHNHCSYMAKITTGDFCRNRYNLTGICNRSSCPLANSRYATILDHEGVFYLYMKTIERAHKPKELWERVKLPRNYEKAMEIIDKHLQYWPKFLVHKIKQRLTKMTQYRIRMRKLELKGREKIMTVPRKEKKREARREEKAEKAANLESVVEKEVLERLKKGVYSGDICNYPVGAYEKVLEMKTLQPTTEEEEEEEEEEKEVVEKELLERLKNSVYGNVYVYPADAYEKVLEMETLQPTTEEEEEEEEEPEVEYVEYCDELEEEEDMEDFTGFPKAESFKDDQYDEEETGPSDRFLKEHRRAHAPDVPGTKSKRAKVLIEVENDEDMGDRQYAHL